MIRFFLIAIFLLFFSMGVFAGTCSVPDINISLSGGGLVQYTDVDYGVLAGDTVTVTCKWSFDPAPSTSCSCSQGDLNCYGVWMTNVFQNGDFNVLSQVPQTSGVDIDCSGAWCATPGRPNEDKSFSQSLTSVADVTHSIACGFREGQNPGLNQISKQVKLHTYSSDLCFPNPMGDFGFDADCLFHDNEVMVNDNYVIQAGTHHSLVDTNVRFYNSSASPHIISVRGNLDYNGSSQIIPGITLEKNEGMLLFGLMGLLLLACYVARPSIEKVVA